MIGVLLVTHDGLGEALAKSVQHVLGPDQPAFECIGVNRQDLVETVQAWVQAALGRLDQGQGVLILTDLFGGTPANVAMSAVQPGRVELVSGVSLPMLVRVMSARQGSLGETVARAVCGGQEGIVVASEMLAYWASCESDADDGREQSPPGAGLQR